MRPSDRRQSVLGFTLLEVMIAVIILAIGLSSLFTSEAGAIKIASRARTTTIATLLARCKMAEVEEKVVKEGWPGDLIEGRDECCEDGEQDGYSCEWKVERIKLPDTEESEDEDEASDEKSGSADGEKKSGGGMIDQLSELSKQEPGDRLTGITDMLSGGKKGLTKDEKKEAEEQESMLDPMASMVMGLAFPMMKPVIEEGVRRASVLVKWKSGDKEQTFEVVQFLVSEEQIIIPESDEDSDGGVPGATPSSQTPASQTPAARSPATQSPAPTTGRK